jgi:cytochrome P450
MRQRDEASLAALVDPEFYAGDPYPFYRALRVEHPLCWSTAGAFWAVSRHADVIAISRDPETFCSSKGVLLSDRERQMGERESIIFLDPPVHAQYRKLVQPAFAPKRIRALEDRIRERAVELCAAIEPDRPVEFVDAVAVSLPIIVIADLLGIPAAHHARFRRWSDAIVDAATRQTEENMLQALELLQYFQATIAERRTERGDDLISTLVHSEVDGERLAESDLLAFCMTLLVAGNETTRNLLSNGAMALAQHPEQRERLVEDPSRIPNAVEEMLRWDSPVVSFVRTATRDTEVRGQLIAAGEQVLLLYSSANRDEDVFGADADRFIVTRNCADQVAFGVGGHFCLGAALARLEGRVLFEELLRRFPHVTPAGEARRRPSVLMRGFVQLPLVFTS